MSHLSPWSNLCWWRIHGFIGRIQLLWVNLDPFSSLCFLLYHWYPWFLSLFQKKNCFALNGYHGWLGQKKTVWSEWIPWMMEIAWIFLGGDATVSRSMPGWFGLSLLSFGIDLDTMASLHRARFSSGIKVYAQVHFASPVLRVCFGGMPGVNIEKP